MIAFEDLNHLYLNGQSLLLASYKNAIRQTNHTKMNDIDLIKTWTSFGKYQISMESSLEFF